MVGEEILMPSDAEKRLSNLEETRQDMLTDIVRLQATLDGQVKRLDKLDVEMREMNHLAREQAQYSAASHGILTKLESIITQHVDEAKDRNNELKDIMNARKNRMWEVAKIAIPTVFAFIAGSFTFGYTWIKTHVFGAP